MADSFDLFDQFVHRFGGSVASSAESRVLRRARSPRLAEKRRSTLTQLLEPPANAVSCRCHLTVRRPLTLQLSVTRNPALAIGSRRGQVQSDLVRSEQRQDDNQDEYFAAIIPPDLGSRKKGRNSLSRGFSVPGHPQARGYA